MRPKDAEKREAIKSAALDLVAEEGLAGLKMAVLARRAGYSPSTLYVYFKDKEALVCGIFRELHQEGLSRVLETSRTERPYKLEFKDFWIRFMQYRLDRHRELFFLQQVRTSPYFDLQLQALEASEMSAQLQLMRKGKEQALLKELPDELLFAAVEGLSDKVADMLRSGELKSSPELLEHCFGIIWDGIKA